MRRYVFQSAVILLVLSMCSACAQVYSVTLNGLAIGIDERTGCIVSMSHPAVGTALHASSESAGLLDVAYPINALPPMRLASRFSKARLIKETNSLTIVWDQLRPSRGNFALPDGKVAAQVRLRAAPDGRSVILTCRIENKSKAQIPQILFPDLHGLKPVDGPNGTQLRLSTQLVAPFAGDVAPRDAVPFYPDMGAAVYKPGGYYEANALRWLDYGSYKGGISVFQKRWRTGNRPSIRTQRREADPMSLRLMWEHRETIEPGQTWESGEFWFTPHHGGWAKGIEPFREYVMTVNPERELPRHVRDGIGYMSIYMMQPPETDPAKAAWRFTDIPRVAEDAKKHGIDELVPWFWGGYFAVPMVFRKELGTKEEFLEGIRKAGELGVNVAPFIDVVFIDKPSAKRCNIPVQTEGLFYIYHPETVPQFDPYYLRPPYPVQFWQGGLALAQADNKTWQRKMRATVMDWFDAGVTSFSWDVFAMWSRRPLDDEKPWLVSFAEELRSKAHARNPEATFSGESCRGGGTAGPGIGDEGPGNLEWESPVLDYTWNWVDYRDVGPLLNVLRWPRLNCNVENSPRIVKMGFADGLYLNVMPRRMDEPNGTALIGEEPALSAALREVSALRRQFLRYFTEGVFIGDCVLSQPTSAHVVGHQLGTKLLVTVLNTQGGPQQVKVESDLDMWLPTTKSCQVKYYDSTGKLLETTSWSDGPHWIGTTRTMQPLDLSFFEIDAS